MVHISSAEGLTLLESFPETGQKDILPDNLMVKLQFNEEVLAEINQDKLMLVDEQGNGYNFQVVQDEDKTKLSLLVEEGSLESGKTYTVIINESFVSESGNTLGSNHEIQFETENPQKKSNMTNMFLTVVVLVIAGLLVKNIKEKNEAEKKKANGKNSQVKNKKKKK